MRTEMDAKGIRSINIQTNEIFLIEINTSRQATISIESHSEGEYFNSIFVTSEIINGELKIESKYPEILTGGYDKLSAHKVFAISLVINIPENLEVHITSNIASVISTGSYKLLFAELKQGYCHLLNFSGNAIVNTFEGDIWVETDSGLVEANTRHGKIIVPEFPMGRNPINLTSIDGDIKVSKTK
ncbi:hypothetical protein [Gramella sp. AN32]|uniref:Adhesin domain-containing protein n=1 Tax=Christiangramia antarctica TaxID=2058158 RepID=A0ABW5X153_9FLAO|nr:hypothetical protein [Gramella sp. AN32]MCM4155117.1 hypothetical protein [Gramella sp. AN32]